jgi:hypothetical protein
MPAQTILRAATSFERQETSTAFQHSVALKLFFALLLNTGLIILVVNAKLDGTQPPSWIGVFGGEFSSFTPRWFTGAHPAVTPALSIEL